MEYRFSLRAARAYADLTMQEAADQLGVNPGTIQSWEKGKTEPKPSTLAQMAELYGVRVEDIFLNKTST